MNETLFNALFDRPIHNLDFLRGRVASCIKPISDGISTYTEGNYSKAFYISTIKFNDKLINHFGLDFLSQTLNEITNFKDFLFCLFNSNNIQDDLKKENISTLLSSYHKLAKHTGYVKRSRILRRYNNFVKISNSFLKGKLSKEEYRKEILNHIIFFEDILKNFQNVDIKDICIYYFVYDIRASENVRKLRDQIKKISI